MRAKNLGRMTDGNYLTAVKAASVRGWRRHEPVPLGNPEQPYILGQLMRSPVDPGLRACLPDKVLNALAASIATKPKT
jgi:hypothetical protein